MKIYTLMENTVVSPELKCSHGLSFYIETEHHKILFDMGQNDDFLYNAEVLGIDISEVDIAFLSHGHYDHGGGIGGFLRVNEKAEIHIQKSALGSYWAQDPEEKRYIGLSDEWKNNERIIFHEGDYVIDDELQIFAGVTERDCYSPANNRLLEKRGDVFERDLFVHEQNLLISENGKTVLFAGCAHNGIVNIMKKAAEITENKPEAVFGGMHLKGAFEKEEELEAFCKDLSEKLLKYDTSYHTCHCTSMEAYEKLCKFMKKNIAYSPAGDRKFI